MATKNADGGELKRVPITEGIFTTPLFPSDQVSLKGCRCQNCNEVLWGKRSVCENCSSEDLEDIVLSRRGRLYTYTISGHRPAGDYKGPDPFVPFGQGLIELPEGLRIVAPLTVNDPRQLKIGMEMELLVEKLYENEDGNEVMAFKFKPV